MTDEPIPSLAEALTEIRAKFGDDALEILRLRAADLTAFEEIRSLRARIAELDAFIAAMPTDDATELRLHNALARIAELEAAPKHSIPDAASIRMFAEAVAAMRAGTLEQPTDTARAYGKLAPPPVDMPRVYTHNIPPNAPPHDE